MKSERPRSLRGPVPFCDLQLSFSRNGKSAKLISPGSRPAPELERRREPTGGWNGKDKPDASYLSRVVGKISAHSDRTHTFPSFSIKTVWGQSDPKFSFVQSPSENKAKEHGVRGIRLGARPNGQELVEIAKIVDAGKLAPVIDRILPLSEARRAHELSQSGHTRGKIVLRVKNRDGTSAYTQSIGRV